MTDIDWEREALVDEGVSYEKAKLENMLALGRVKLARYEAKVRLEAVADALGLDAEYEAQLAKEDDEEHAYYFAGEY